MPDAVLEQMILPSLAHGGYAYVSQVLIGQRPGGRRHFVDVIAEKRGQKFLVSLKYQDSSGTAEEEVTWEVICMMRAVATSDGQYSRAYLVLGGIGWTLRDFYVQGGLKDYLDYEGLVEIVTLEQFIAIANRGRL
ncbi:MAG TPA: PD-(D/E)XK nuclease superfamily protein [Blastocatellia bacterium]|nr:PD-(D/E)XK nuclease superfamily protein [Blastocatellia bacterium]